MHFFVEQPRRSWVGASVAMTLVSLIAACQPAPPQSIPCNHNDDCPTGAVCGAGRCRVAIPAPDAGQVHADATVFDGTAGDVARIDLGSTDRHVRDAGGGDTAVADSAVGDPAALTLDPNRYVESWLVQGERRSFVSTVQRTDAAALGDLEASSDAPWLQVNLTSVDSLGSQLDLVIDSSALAAGVYGAEVRVRDSDPRVRAATLHVQIRVLDWPLLHVGPALGACPHEVRDGTFTSNCDYWGADGLANAINDITEPGLRVLLYASGDAPFVYNGCLDVPGDTWLSAAPGLSPEQVLITCHPAVGEFGGATLRLVGAGVHLQGLTLVAQQDAVSAISTWSTDPLLEAATSGHLLEDLILWAVMPEVVGSNSIVQAMQLGADTTLRNSRVLGYFEGHIDLRRAHRSRIEHNTFALYQPWGSGFDLRGVQDLVFANNVVLSLSRTETELLTASPFTGGLVVAGNLAEGFDALIGGLEAGGSVNEIVDNTVGPRDVAELESPLRPLFLADSGQRASARVPGQGQSLDGVALEGRADRLPGAYQRRSELVLPRRSEIRVGERDCGGQPCDVLTSEPNEIQRAVWSVWPGGVVRVYPSSQPYAGNAIISWQQDLVGMSQLAEPDDVVLQGREEDLLLRSLGLWERHGAVLVLLRPTLDQMRVEGLSLVVDSSSQASRMAVFVDAWGENGGLHDLRRLKIGAIDDSTSGANPPQQALLLGERVRVQDLLVVGDFGSCLRFGPRRRTRDATPDTTGWVANLSCDLTGSGSRAPRAAFEVAGATHSTLINLVVKLADSAPLFVAQRRSSGDRGTTALDAPTGLTVQAVSYQNADADCEGFDCGSGFSYIDQVLSGSALFASGSDHHLSASSPAIDSGVEPVDVDPNFAPSLSLDGVLRAGHVVDRGCYEQGL